MSSFSNKKVIPGYRFTCGITFFYLSLILLIPLAAFVLYTAGMGWEKFLGEHKDLIAAQTIENHLIPDLYRSAKATMNDHWDDMREKQFVNNRIFDALACGLPVISDTCDELREIFPKAVLHYSTREEYEACVRRIRDDYPAVKAEVLAQWPLIRKEYSFEARARELMRIAAGDR